MTEEEKRNLKSSCNGKKKSRRKKNKNFNKQKNILRL